jgi:RNA polymerase sporulation-specific sigma factor
MLDEESETKMCKNNLTDEEILKSEDAVKAFELLSERYTGRVIALAITFNSTFTASDSNDDLIEEGLIALFRAIETYDENRGAKFSTYAYTCIKNRLKDAVKNENKHRRGDDLRLLSEIGVTDVDFTAEIQELIDNNLTKLEADIFRLRQSGMSYSEIAEIKGIPAKSVDNAFYRGKNKLKKILRK